MTEVVFLFVLMCFLLIIWTLIVSRYFLMLFDDLKSRIDRRVDEDKWQNEYINQHCSRESKLEKED